MSRRILSLRLSSLRSRSVVRRVRSSLVAAAAALAILDCSTFAASAYDGTLDASGLVVPARAPATLSEILLGAPGTYVERLLADRDSILERWPDRVTEPLRIWIDSSETISGEQAGFPAAVRAAFDQWVSTGIPVRLAYVANEGDANIRVHWTDHLNRKTGSTTWRTDRSGYLTGGDITLATHVSDGRPLDARGMRAIALHEVGHALGLSHSLDAGDVMASLVRVDGLSASDRGTIKLLYSLPAGHVR